MYEKIDIEKLRDELLNYYGTAMFNSSPLAIIELSKIQRATNEELIIIAQNNNIDLTEYIYKTKSR